MSKRKHISSVMKPEYLALIENFRLMDDIFMSKCFENAPECIELMLRIIRDWQVDSRFAVPRRGQDVF